MSDTKVTYYQYEGRIEIEYELKRYTLYDYYYNEKNYKYIPKDKFYWFPYKKYRFKSILSDLTTTYIHLKNFITSFKVDQHCSSGQNIICLDLEISKQPFLQPLIHSLSSINDLLFLQTSKDCIVTNVC